MAVNTQAPAAGSTTQTYLTQGNAAMRAGNYSQALTLFEQALTQSPALAKVIEFNIKLAKSKLSNGATASVLKSPVLAEKNAVKPTVVERTAPPAALSIPVKVVSSYEGRLEKNDLGAIRGWAVNKSKPAEIFDLSVLVDDVFFCKVKNHDNRADLQRAGKSAGKGGYSLVIPQDILDADVHTVSITYPDGSVLATFTLDGVTHTAPDDIVLLPVDEKVSVIVPIYNAVDDVKVCIERLKKYTNKDVDIILINDASPDKAIKLLLEDAAKESNFRVYHNDKNLGFTKTVNRGIELAGTNDVILLNSDARVTPRWIQGFKRALATDHKIATVTAMSDRAGAFSAPNIGNDNDLPAGIKEEEYAVAFRRRAVGYYPTVPTGNGFCMYIRRSCINEIGGLDAEAFPRGYGEENDFCMRARAAGWRNVIDDRTYVFHDRSKSFGGEKDELIKAGRAVVDTRYPDYGKAIQIFSQSPLISMARFKARKAVDDSYEIIKPRALYVISTVTGGTPQTNRDLMFALHKTLEPWLFRCDSKKMTLYKVLPEGDVVVAQHVLKEPVDPLTHQSAEYDRVIFSWLSRYDFELVHVRHLAWHSLSLLRLAKKAGAKVINSFHDFYALCPTVKLIDGDGIFCGSKCTSGINSCKAELWPDGSIPDLKHAWVTTWREKFSAALNYCDAFVTTSQSARQTVKNGLNLDESIPFEVIEHGRDFSKFKSINLENTPDGKIKVLVPGNLDDAKGLNVIRQLLVHDVNKTLEFHLLGKCDVEINDARVIKYGAYKREEFINHVEKIQPHLGVVFSIWDETWCHTLTELWASGLPAVVFEYPTVSARVKSSDAGWVANADTNHLYKLLTTICSDTSEYKAKLSNVKKWQEGFGLFNNIRFMAAQYLNLYKGRSGAEVKNFVAVVSPADPNLEKAAGSTHVRVWQKTHNSLLRNVTYTRFTPSQLIAGIKAGVISSAIIQRNVLTLEDWLEIKPFVDSDKFKFYFDLDDDLLNVPKDKDENGFYANYRSTLKEIITNASIVFTSTDYLYERIKAFNERVVIECNKLSRHCWLARQQYKGNSSLKALYFGSFTHKQDLELIMPALNKVWQTFPNFRLKVVGISSDDYKNEPFIEKVNIPVDCRDYEKFSKWLFDISTDCSFGLAPLVENEFNRSKSALKVLEYRALSLDVFASAFGNYFSVSSYCVSLVENSLDDWFEKISSYLNNLCKKSVATKKSGISDLSDFIIDDDHFDSYFT